MLLVVSRHEAAAVLTPAAATPAAEETVGRRKAPPYFDASSSTNNCANIGMSELQPSFQVPLVQRAGCQSPISRRKRYSVNFRSLQKVNMQATDTLWVWVRRGYRSGRSIMA